MNHQILAFATAAITALSLGACATVQEAGPALFGNGAIANRAGATMGEVRLFEDAGVMTVSVSVRGLAPGAVHAVHLHTTGNCSAADFTSAGGHLNPAGVQHGSLNPQGAHLGDLPNLTVGQDGSGAVSARLPGSVATLTGQIFDADGTAVIVHEAPDDYRTDPTGSAGARLACGVIARR